MKKILSGLLLVAMNFTVFGYSDMDVEHANYLAEKGIIRDRSSDVSQYRLDDKISRQEVIAIAMKLSGEAAPEDYNCRGYFSDAKFAKKHPDAWVCTQVELAADKGVVSRENKKFRPKANITKAEALAMIMRGAGVIVTQGVKIGHTDLPVTASYSSNVPQWQIDMIESAQANQVIDVYANNAPETDFAPNALATRAQVFEFAANILQNFGGASENRLRDNNNGTTTYTSVKHDFTMTVPTRGVQLVSEDKPDETGEGIQSVFGYSVLFNGGTSRFLVKKYPCHGECSDPNLVQQFYQETEKGFQSEGVAFTKLNNNTYELKDTEWAGYMKVVMQNDTVYIVYALVDFPDWSSSKGALQEIVNTFKVR